ncbi:MAG TPA: hypothetical protein PLA90_08835 [Candidatus Sumerlaeota bacterium]|nr:hypothetical protein [Candidatus Sumerlaeota bacterium]HPS01635.1 hypothetical protein [Candidatus Sumerlaeota bacterium]
MKIVKVETLIHTGSFSKSSQWKEIRRFLHNEIKAMEHPVGSGKFILHPESGKKRGQGNGVTPIKAGLMDRLRQQGWSLEEPMDIATRKKPGKLDAVLRSKKGNIAVEWETGNISSSHRALNKLCIGLMKKQIVAGVLIVPSREMYQYLTDRVGNYSELEPYLDLWRAIPCDNGVLEIVVVEHDEISIHVSKIAKGTDGRALN